MSAHGLSQVIQNLRRITLADEARVTDGQLLDQFIQNQDEFAFDALVKRHSPMVWGVCRRVVAHHQDAEDAFQATFLVLARKASSIRPREMVANWLYGVAHRTALKARTMAGKRQAREKQMATIPEPQSGDRVAWENLESLIDQELANLPDKYRVAIVMCDLEGKKGKDVARQLKIPEGTLASRLRTARMMLAKRLTRQGMTLSVGALATALSQNATSACAPSMLVSMTIKAATLTAAGQAATAGLISANVAAITQGVMKTMFLVKLKTVLYALLVLGVAAFGGTWLSQHAAEGQQSQAAGTGQNPATAQEQSRPKSVDELLLHGEWFCRDDKRKDDHPMILIFGPGKTVVLIEGDGSESNGTYDVNWNKKPHELDLKVRLRPEGPVRLRTIMEFNGSGKFRMEFGEFNAERPEAITKDASIFVREQNPKAGSQQANAQAEKDLGIAEFYRQAAKPWTANFYYELVLRRYPDTPFAEKARQGIQAVDKFRTSVGWRTPEQAEKPEPAKVPPEKATIPPAPKPATSPVLRGEVLKVKSADLFVSLVVESNDQIIYLTSGREKKGDVTYRVNDKTVVQKERSNEKITFAQIRPGDQISIQLDASNATVRQIVILSAYQ